MRQIRLVLNLFIRMIVRPVHSMEQFACKIIFFLVSIENKNGQENKKENEMLRQITLLTLETLNLLKL